MKHRKVIICLKCNGAGKITEHYLTDYHKRDYDLKFHQCKHCNSTGRLVETTEITIKPFSDE